MVRLEIPLLFLVLGERSVFDNEVCRFFVDGP